MGPITNWTPSDVPYLNNCLYQLYLRKAKGYYVQGGEAATRGEEMHKGVEDYINGQALALPRIKSHADYIDSLRERQFSHHDVMIEQRWGFDRNWSPVPWKDRWFGMRTDCAYKDSPTSLIIDDWKTGKKYGNEAKHKVQGQGYAIGGFMQFKDVEHVQINMRYLDQAGVREQILTSNYTRESIAPLIPIWTNRGLEITTMTEFPASPFPSRCEYCDYRPWNPDCPEEMQCKFGVQR